MFLPVFCTKKPDQTTGLGGFSLIINQLIEINGLGAGT